jgi:hypothetical protein
LSGAATATLLWSSGAVVQRANDAHRTAAHATETYLALRETAEVKTDPATLRALAEAREGVSQGDVVYGTEAVRALIAGRRVS